MTSAAQARAGRRTSVSVRDREAEHRFDAATRIGLGALAAAVAEQASYRELCRLAAEHAARSVGAVSGALGRFSRTPASTWRRPGSPTPTLRRRPGPTSSG
jgi:hypothetical protein